MTTCLLGLVAMALALQLSHSQPVIYTRCFEDVSLPCEASTHGTKYRYVAWYKVNHNARTGLIRKNMDEKAYRYQNSVRMTSLGDSEALLLPVIKQEDSGTYECNMGAYVGGKSQTSAVHLNVSECVTLAPPLATLTVGNFSEKHNIEQELSPVLILSGFSVFSLIKALLCYVFFRTSVAISSR